MKLHIVFLFSMTFDIEGRNGVFTPSAGHCGIHAVTEAHYWLMNLLPGRHSLSLAVALRCACEHRAGHVNPELN